MGNRVLLNNEVLGVFDITPIIDFYNKYKMYIKFDNLSYPELDLHNIDINVTGYLTGDYMFNTLVKFLFYAHITLYVSHGDIGHIDNINFVLENVSDSVITNNKLPISFLDNLVSDISVLLDISNPEDNNGLLNISNFLDSLIINYGLEIYTIILLCEKIITIDTNLNQCHYGLILT